MTKGLGGRLEGKKSENGCSWWPLMVVGGGGGGGVRAWVSVERKKSKKPCISR